ncbi:MAG: glycosyltransferase [Actinomycetota bacterium]|nr:glycosyltransferase [Actinomycetota bacterium]
MGEGGAGQARPTASIVIVSKDEPAIAATLAGLGPEVALAVPDVLAEVEVVVVDASWGRLAEIRDAFPEVRWIDFEPPAGARITIAHQRNVGVRAAAGDIIVFTDCGCVPEPAWLSTLVEPIVSGQERMTCGRVGATGTADLFARARLDRQGRPYLKECPTINVAFGRDVFDEVGDFDESFEYGSDIDFSWRAVHHGVRIKYRHDAVVLHDWGSRSRQVRRSFAYGKGRARLYAKHVFGSGAQSSRKRRFDEHDAVPVMYSLFLLGLPIALRFRAYLLLLLIPLWRSRRQRPVYTLVDHLVLAAGVLVGACEQARTAVVRRGEARSRALLGNGP